MSLIRESLDGYTFCGPSTLYCINHFNNLIEKVSEVKSLDYLLSYTNNLATDTLKIYPLTKGV